MPRLHWIARLIAIILTFAPFGFWVWDAMLAGSSKFFFALAMLWLPSIVLSIITILIWESVADTWLVRFMYRVSFVGAWLNLAMAGLILYHIFGDYEAIVPDSLDSFLSIYGAFHFMLLLPAAMTFIPVSVLSLWRGGRKRSFLAIVALFVLIGSWLITSQRAEDSLRVQHDPCYEIVEGKLSSSYHGKGDWECVVYYETTLGESYFKTLDGADAASFENVGYAYAKDSRHVYDGEKRVDFVDRDSFRFLGSGYYADRERVFYGLSRPLAGADPSSFVVLPGNYYAKDADHVYFHESELLGADAASFSVITDGYAKDTGRVYYSGRTIEGAHPEYFKLFNPRCSTDNAHVFCYDTMLDGIDVRTFRPIGDSDYIRDEDTMYYLDRKVDGVNVSAFRITSRDCGTDGIITVCSGEIKR